MYYVKKQINDLAKDTARDVVPGLISAVVPTHSPRRETLPKALRAIDAQTYPHIEIIMAGHGIDDAAALARSAIRTREYRVIPLENNLGASLARNTGALASRGEFLWFVDSDIDAIDPKCAAHALHLLRTHPNIGALGGIRLVEGTSSRFTIGRLTFPDGRQKEPLPELIDDDYVNTACVFVPRSVFFRIQGFTEYIEYLHDDNDFGFKILAAGYRCVGTPLCAGTHPVRSGQPSLFYEFMAQKNTLLYLFINYTMPSFRDLLRKKKEFPDFSPARGKRSLRQRMGEAWNLYGGRLAGTLFFACHFLSVIKLRRERQRFLSHLRRTSLTLPSEGKPDDRHDHRLD